MMQGNNSMQLNHVTMVAAVQMYVDSLFQEGKAPKVASVKHESRAAGTGYYFIVELAEPEIIEDDGLAAIPDRALVIKVSHKEADSYPEAAEWVAKAMTALAPAVNGSDEEPRAVLLLPGDDDAPTG